MCRGPRPPLCDAPLSLAATLIRNPLLVPRCMWLITPRAARARSNPSSTVQGQFAAIHLMPYGKKTYFDSYIKV